MLPCGCNSSEDFSCFRVKASRQTSPACFRSFSCSGFLTQKRASILAVHRCVPACTHEHVARCTIIIVFRCTSWPVTARAISIIIIIITSAYTQTHAHTCITPDCATCAYDNLIVRFLRHLFPLCPADLYFRQDYKIFQYTYIYISICVLKILLAPFIFSHFSRKVS